jgi:hypothetical protein
MTMPGMKNTMKEYKKGALHSGSKKGPIVKSRKQAIAIGLSEERKKDGAGKPMSKARHKKMYSFPTSSK